MPSTSDPITRQRLLDAAGEVFADLGFRTATVRDICQRAEANGAAVHYHFGDKEGLYAEVVRYAHSCALAQHPTGEPAQIAKLKPVEQLRTFVYAFLCRLLDAGRPAWHAKLMAREMVEPSHVLDRIVEEAIRPQMMMLVAIVRAVAGVELPPATMRRTTASVVSQCLFYHHARPVIGRLFPDLVFDADETLALAEHITAFSFAGIQRVAKAHKP